MEGVGRLERTLTAIPPDQAKGLPTAPGEELRKELDKLQGTEEAFDFEKALREYVKRYVLRYPLIALRS
jgi:hypothetical protein